MKTEHETEITFDRISTREELCEVIDLLCDSGKATLAEASRRRRQKGSGPISTGLLSEDSAYDLDLDEEENGKSSQDQGPDEWSDPLTDLFASRANWLN